MKKIVWLSIVLFAISTTSAFAVTVAADATWTAADTDGSIQVGATTTGAAVVKLSKNVKINYTEQAAGLGYSVGTYHISGTKTFASSSGDSKIWTSDTTGATIPTAPTGTDSANFSGWTAL